MGQAQGACTIFVLLEVRDRRPTHPGDGPSDVSHVGHHPRGGRHQTEAGGSGCLLPVVVQAIYAG